jgi:DNA-binding XRE family transcriptional regulator
MHSCTEHHLEKLVLRRCGEVLATRRHELKLKQAEVALAIGLKVGTLSRLENGKQWVRMEILVRLALLFDLEVAELFPPLVDSLYHHVCLLLRRSDPALQDACHTMLAAALRVKTKGRLPTRSLGKTPLLRVENTATLLREPAERAGKPPQCTPVEMYSGGGGGYRGDVS